MRIPLVLFVTFWVPLAGAADELLPVSLDGPVNSNTGQASTVAALKAADLAMKPRVVLSEIQMIDGKVQRNDIAVVEISTITQDSEPDPEAANQSPGCGGCGREACCCNSCWLLSLDFLYLQSRGSDLGFAVPTDQAFGSPLDSTEQLDYDYDGGLRMHVAKRGPGTSWLEYTGTHYNTQTSVSAVPAAGLTLGTVLLASPIPLDADSATTNFARARGEIGLDTYDLGYSDQLISFCGADISGLLGVRVASQDESVRVEYDEDTVTSGINLRGAGIRGALRGKWTCGNWSLFGSSSLSVLATTIELDYQQTNVLAGRVVNFDQDVDRVVPVIDLELGIGYDMCWRNKTVTLALGYTFSNWIDVVTTAEMVKDIQRADFSGNVEDDLTFDGVFARISMMF